MSFVSYTPRPGSQESVFDMGRLSDLKRDAKADPNGTAQQKQIAKQFEALFLQMMIKRMREAMPKGGLFDSDQSKMLQSIADEQMALQMANPGVGLARALLGQMQQGTPGDVSNDALTAGVAANATGTQMAGLGLSTAAFSPRDLRGTSIKMANGASGEVGALLNVLRTNRRSDREMAVAEGAPEHVVSFVSKMSRAAHAAARESGVPARLIMSQAALESGWGKREIKNDDGSTSYNLFGIKAGSSWQGKVVNVMTTEFVDGEAKKMVQPFRAYSSYEESFSDYARLVGDNPRYEAVTQTRDENEAARRIQAAGYATDPKYAEKLISIMEQLRATVANVNISGQR